MTLYNGTIKEGFHLVIKIRTVNTFIFNVHLDSLIEILCFVLK